MAAETDRAARIAQGIIAACPLAQPGDGAARDTCAKKLGELGVLQASMASPVRWGGQSLRGNYDLAKNSLTDLDPRVFSTMYLSTFMFSGKYRVEDLGGGRLVIHLPDRFRVGLDPGDFPYPFWHSEKKWSSYERAREVVLVMQDGKVLGGMRSFEQDQMRPVVAHTFDNKWQWSDAHGNVQPRVTLFRYLFHDGNPYTASVDRSYRAFEAAARPYNCSACHVPSNPTKMNPLAFFIYPNQALGARHMIVDKLQHKLMPPGGIADDAARTKLVSLAKAFAAEGDKALNYEMAHFVKGL